MAQPFVHTLRSLQDDSGRAVSLGLAGLLLACVVWGLWLYYAHITVYEVSAKTRLEVAGANVPSQSEAAGKPPSGAVTKRALRMPSDDLVIVAEFEPATALGRIKPQQNAKLRLTAFPWLEFGVVSARVIKVASEVRDGTIRVEMAIVRDSQSLIPFQPGLQGTVAVEVERVTPAALILRSLGSRLDGPAR